MYEPKENPKIKIFILLCFMTLTIFGQSDTKGKEELKKGVIGKTVEDGKPVIWKFVNEYPDKTRKDKYQWLTVVSWKYDGKSNNGMPLKEINNQMIKLEEAIEDIQKKELCIHAYSRTGNNLKELVYYIPDQTKFMKAFNEALKNHPKYPIKINFYKDSNWKDFTKLLDLFNKKKVN